MEDEVLEDQEDPVQKFLSNIGPAERLSADDFLEKIKTSKEWHVVSWHSGDEFLELYVIEDGEIYHYLPPDFIAMGQEEIFRFFLTLNEMTQGPGSLSKAIKGGNSGPVT